MLLPMMLVRGWQLASSALVLVHHPACIINTLQTQQVLQTMDGRII
jgi:hypothetical protein